jgi:ribosome-associated protein YbcJ (S4-like RNA binding protein)
MGKDKQAKQIASNHKRAVQKGEKTQNSRHQDRKLCKIYLSDTITFVRR